MQGIREMCRVAYSYRCVPLARTLRCRPQLSCDGAMPTSEPSRLPPRCSRSGAVSAYVSRPLRSTNSLCRGSPPMRRPSCKRQQRLRRRRKDGAREHAHERRWRKTAEEGITTALRRAHMWGEHRQHRWRWGAGCSLPPVGATTMMKMTAGLGGKTPGVLLSEEHAPTSIRKPSSVMTLHAVEVAFAITATIQAVAGMAGVGGGGGMGTPLTPNFPRRCPRRPRGKTAEGGAVHGVAGDHEAQTKGRAGVCLGLGRAFERLLQAGERLSVGAASARVRVRHCLEGIHHACSDGNFDSMSVRLRQFITMVLYRLSRLGSSGSALRRSFGARRLP